MGHFFSERNVRSLAQALRSATRTGLKLLVLSLALTGLMTTAIAQQESKDASQPVRTVTLDVKGMYCPLCAKTVTKALNKVPGVIEAKVDNEAQTAVVTFDSGKTDVGAITRATTNAGFPSALKE